MTRKQVMTFKNDFVAYKKTRVFFLKEDLAATVAVSGFT